MASTPYPFVVGGQTSVITDSSASNAILINCTDTAGGIDINAGTATGPITVDAGGSISLDAGAASNYTTSSGDLTLAATTNSVNLTGAEAVVDAITITATNAAGGVDINAGITSGVVTIDAGGAISLDAGASSNFTTSTGDITMDASTGAAGILLEAGTSGVRILSPNGLHIHEPAGGGSSYVEVTAPALSTNPNFTLPPDNGTNAFILQTDGAGITTWIAKTAPTTCSPPTSIGSDTQLLTIAHILTGILTRDMGAAATWTLPTAALLVGGLASTAVDETCLDFYIINENALGANDITLEIGAGGTMVGNVRIPSASTTSHNELSSAHFRIRVTDVTPASENYTCYRLA